MVWAAPKDVIAAWIGVDQPTDTGQLSLWLGKAERLVRREFPDLTSRLEKDEEPDLAENVRDVLVAMVTRVFRNPEGVRQRQETDGSFTGSITFGGDQPGVLFLTDAEKDLLRDPSNPGRGQAFHINTGTSTIGQHYPWCDRMWNRSRCSCGADIAGYPIYET